MLECGERRVHLSPKALDTLRVLVEARGEVVDKDELMQRVWPDAFVQETGLARNISVLRKTIEESGGSAAWIETLPKRGYRFTAPVDATPSPTSVSDRPGVSRGRIFLVVAAVISVACWTIWPDPTAPESAQPENPQVLIGRHLLHKSTPEDARRAVAAFEEAIRTDPDSAAAHFGYADAVLSLVMMASAPQEALRDAEIAAERAVTLEPGLADAHATLGALRLASSWDLAGAAESLKAANELDPHSLRSLYYESRRLTALRRFDEALTLLESARRIDPVSVYIDVQVGYNYYAKRDFESARKVLQGVLQRERTDAHAHYYMALTLAYLGRFDDALTELSLSELRAEVLETDAAWIRARQGNEVPLRAHYRELQRRVREDGLESAALLLPASALGETAEGIRALEAAFGNRAPELIHMLSDPRMDTLRAHPRFRDLFVRHGLGEAFASSDE